MTSEKCQYFDKGFCRSRDKCSLKHPLVECEGSCEDRRICPKRHRVFCKNGNECVFDLTNSCEFLHKADNKNTEQHRDTLQSMIKHVEGKIEELDKKDKETVNKIDTLVKDTCDWITKVFDTEKEVAALVAKVDDIEEEFSSKLEQVETSTKKNAMDCEGTIIRLEKKMEVLESLVRNLLNEQKCKVTPGEGHVYSEDSYSNPSRKDNIENKECKTTNQTKCDICQKIFKSTDNLQTHDEKFHMKIIANKGRIFKCDQCGFTSKDKSEVHDHINERHKKCDICERIFTNSKTLETHVKAIHKKEIIKHKLEREPSLQNHKIKKIT